MFHHAPVAFPQLTQVNLPNGRVYRVESGEAIGEVYPSITRVLSFGEKPQLDAWKKRVGHEEAAKVAFRAQSRGTGLHKHAECYLGNRQTPTLWPHVAELWQHLRPWLDAHITCVYGQECDLVSHKLGVAGRTDLLADVDGVRSIVDFKQSDKPKKEEYIFDYFLQSTFYACAVYELTGLVVKQIVIPITSPQGGLQVFVDTPSEWFEPLRECISYFYDSYDKAVDAASASVI